jgi:hypothetical protein
MDLLQKDRSTMKPQTFHLRQSMIDRLAQITEQCKIANPDLNKSDIFREALKRGLDSIESELKKVSLG